MRYPKITLNGCTRFALNEFDHFEMVIHSPLQLIIGTNGSGKSSLLEMLSPLPADISDFKKSVPNCGKVVEIEHQHRHYVLTSRFAPKREFSFVCDGVELNEGGTVTVYLDLVREHFGITAEIHKLLLGKEKFDTMSAARRKEWFLKLCDTNYDYAIRVYNKARDQQRDTKGALNLARRTLVQESEKLLGDVEVNRLKAEIDSLHECLNDLLEHRKPLDHDLDNLDIQQQQLDRQLLTLARTLETLQLQLQDNTLTVDDYTVLIGAAQEEIVRATALLDNASTVFRKNGEKIDLLQRAEAKSSDNLRVEVEATAAEITKLLDASLVQTGIPNAQMALTLFEELKTPLNTVFAEIPVNDTRQYSSQGLQQAREQIAELNRKKMVEAEQLERSRIGVRHMEAHRDHPDLKCPKCSHLFSAQYHEGKHVGLKQDVDKRTELITKQYEPKIKELEDYIVRCSEYGQSYRTYVTLTHSASMLAPYWRLREDLVKDAPRSGIHWLEEIHTDLLRQVEVEKLTKVLNEKRELMFQLKSIGSVDLQGLVEQNRVLEEQLVELTLQLQKTNNTKKTFQAEQQRLRQFLELRSKIQKVIQQKRVLAQDTFETIRRQEFNALVRALQSELATRVERMGTAAQQKAIVDNLGKRIDEYIAQEKAWAILVKELSPTEGLIAEGLLGFVKNFVDQMNALIRSIWSYPLTVQSCEVMDGAQVELDWRFPLKIASRPDPVPDVSKGSTGMIEIVNMAFKMTAMQYLHLQDSPLYLDELGATMDVTHKAETVYIIKTLVEQQTFPQVFLISHDFHQYGALANCEITLLNNLNVAAPSGMAVNQHVKMT